MLKSAKFTSQTAPDEAFLELGFVVLSGRFPYWNFAPQARALAAHNNLTPRTKTTRHAAKRQGGGGGE